MGPLVVCAVDDSSRAREAITVATAFAELLDATLLPVHVLPDEPGFPYGDQAERERQRRAAIETVRTIVGHDPLPDARQEGLRIEIGRPAERLAAVARERDAAMLVVGSRGRGAVKSALLGSVTAELLSSSPCPLLVVPPGAVGRAVGRWPSRPRPASVLCGVDGSAGAQEAAGVASLLAARTGKRLVLAHAYQPDTSSRSHASILLHYPGLLWSERQAGLRLLEAAEEKLTRLPVPELRLAAGDPAPAMRRLARRERAVVIVVGSRGRGALRGALFGSVSGALAASAPVPVLVVPEGKSDAMSSQLPADTARPAST
jgi:nucleotide-binding universal stress UspA family protein